MIRYMADVLIMIYLSLKSKTLNKKHRKVFNIIVLVELMISATWAGMKQFY